jgi:hypothetical protein
MRESIDQIWLSLCVSPFLDLTRLFDIHAFVMEF